MQAQDNSSGSEYNQQSFAGGMKLSLEDNQLDPDEYRVAFNVRNRFGKLDQILSSVLDETTPAGIKQEMVTFGSYEILFVSGSAYYKYYLSNNWTKIAGFTMNPLAPRYWTKAVPVATTNYLRFAGSFTLSGSGFSSSSEPINVNNVAGAGAGNLPGLLVQDGVNQPRFIFLDSNLLPVCRITQKFEEWSITFTNATNLVVSEDAREYVPVGKSMEFVDGILYIASPDGTKIYRSVEGRPLDFVVAVSSALVTVSPFKQVGAGDADATAYTVGVGDIAVLRAMQDGSLFVGAGNANFSVAKNMNLGAPMVFGEYTFLRNFLFNAVCLSDRTIFDSIGDTRFITLTGVRSFNAISQTRNEGRNLPFTTDIRAAFGDEGNPIIQDAAYSAAILFNDYELYAVNTIFGPAIAVYDTIKQCWSSFDVSQTGGKRVKQFAKIELSIQVLYAVTEDDKIYRLYVGPNKDVAKVRTVGVSSSFLYGNQNIKMANPKMEIQLRNIRAIINNITSDCVVTAELYVNNRRSRTKTLTKTIKYVAPTYPTNDSLALNDVDSMLENLLWSATEAEQGWKLFLTFSWTNGSLSQFSLEMNDVTPMNPARSQ